MKGFTLVEILVSMALFMAITVGLISLTQLSVKSTASSRLRVQASTVLHQTMEATMAVRASNFSDFSQGTYHPQIIDSKWTLVSGTETIGGAAEIERWVEISRIQREISCGGERVCPIVTSGGVVDPVTFKAKVVVVWSEQGQDHQEELESLLTFWR